VALKFIIGKEHEMNDDDDADDAVISARQVHTQKPTQSYFAFVSMMATVQSLSNSLTFPRLFQTFQVDICTEYRPSQQ